MTIQINIDDALNVTLVNRPTHHKGFRILYADGKTAQFVGNGELCDHPDCEEAAILESNNEDILCQDHAEEYRPCDSCDIHVRAGDNLGYGEDYLCPDCFVPATTDEDKEHAMALDPHAVRGDTGWVDPNPYTLCPDCGATFIDGEGHICIDPNGTKRFNVMTINEGTDYAVVVADPDDDPEESFASHEAACKEARILVGITRRNGAHCNWYDHSGHDGQGETCTECEAFRPRVDGTIIDGKWVCSDCTHNQKMEEDEEALDQMSNHDWLIYDVCFNSFEEDIRIAIHRDVVKPVVIGACDHSSPNPDDSISRFGPGTCARSLDHIDDLFHDVNHVHMLTEQGYIDGQKAHLIFKAQGGAK